MARQISDVKGFLFRAVAQMNQPEPLRSCREDIPKEFPEILKDLTKEILLAQPKSTKQIYGVAAGT